MSARMKLAYEELGITTAIETAETLSKVRAILEASSDENLQDVREKVAAVEKVALESAWAKVVKKHPGICKVFAGGGGGVSNLAKKAKKLKKAIKDLDSKTEKKRLVAGKVVLTTILWLSGYPLAGVLGPWLTEKNFKILKWQGKQVYKAIDWMLKNADKMGTGIKDFCKDVKPELPDKVEKVLKESK